MKLPPKWQTTGQADPINDSPVPEDTTALVKFGRDVFNCSVDTITGFTSGLRNPQTSNEALSYTLGEHLSIQMALAFVLHQAKLIGVLGRDKRNAMEQRLLERIEALEARSTDLKYRSVWKSDTLCRTGNFVTDGGSIFHANRASVGERPGTSDSFPLAVKKGKDAKS
jgi:hypothetical protein